MVGFIHDCWNGQEPTPEAWEDEMQERLNDMGAPGYGLTVKVWLRASEVQPFLAQAESWRDINNKTIPLTEIDARYAGNIVSYLERKAPELMEMVDDYTFYVEAETETIGDHRPLVGRVDPVLWMRDHKLYQAIKKIAEGEAFKW